MKRLEEELEVDKNIVGLVVAAGPLFAGPLFV